ncbi:type IV pilus secretin PilQ [Ignatzschineria indica]|uniref:type IV pilus secretin PilQ n=1 Tax=Ignatzschineria indica TaxID=472583 RepID=UPI002577EAAB|nr:type IV pilus secretin PilQ [Ignatzschineria indica]MDM1544290.1 type IV pilus secretin PilQ [Ignatzschineria indica]
MLFGSRVGAGESRVVMQLGLKLEQIRYLAEKQKAVTARRLIVIAIFLILLLGIILQPISFGSDQIDSLSKEEFSDNMGSLPSVIATTDGVPDVQNSQSSQNGEPLYSFSLNGVSLSYFVNLLAKESGRNIIVDPTVDQHITLHLNQMSFSEILELLLLYTGLSSMEVNGVIMIASHNTFARMNQEKIITEVVALHYAEAKEIAEILRGKASGGSGELRGGGNGSTFTLGVDHRLNQVVITASVSEMRELKRLIDQLDQPAQQVEISAYIVAAFDDFAKELGVNWGLNYQRGAYELSGTIPNEQAGAGHFGGQLGSLTSLGVSLPDFSMGYMILGKGLNLGLEISAMQSEGRGEMLSNPTILTTSRRAAYIKQGTEVSYSTSSNEGTNTEFKDAVMELNVVPQITPKGKILIDILISKDEISGYDPKGEPIISKKELKTQALVNHGETIVLGGIYEYDTATTLSEVPFLSRLPFLGRLFKREGNKQKKAELLIFIRPRIVDTLSP